MFIFGATTVYFLSFYGAAHVRYSIVFMFAMQFVVPPSRCFLQEVNKIITTLEVPNMPQPTADEVR